MANAAKMLTTRPVRGLIVGYPKGGKTGSLVSLINAGFKVRIIDFDGNPEPILAFANPAMLANVDIVHFEDKMRMAANWIEPVGVPHAFADALKMMSQWKYKEADGTEVDLGASNDWGLDTVVVVDGLTGMGDASKARAMKLLNKGPGTMTKRVWNLAMSEQLAFVKEMAKESHHFHVLLLSHLKMVGPQDIEKDDSDMTADLKKRAIQLVDTRLYPSALGRALPPLIGAEFPTLILAEAKYGPGKKVTRVLRTVPRPDLDLGVPYPDFPAELPIETGLLDIFKKLSPGAVELVLQQKEKLND